MADGSCTSSTCPIGSRTVAIGRVKCSSLQHSSGLRFSLASNRKRPSVPSFGSGAGGRKSSPWDHSRARLHVSKSEPGVWAPDEATVIVKECHNVAPDNRVSCAGPPSNSSYAECCSIDLARGAARREHECTPAQDERRAVNGQTAHFETAE